MYTIERKCNFPTHTHAHSSKGTKYEHVEEIFMSFENVRKMKDFFLNIFVRFRMQQIVWNDDDYDDILIHNWFHILHWGMMVPLGKPKTAGQWNKVVTMKISRKSRALGIRKWSQTEIVIWTRREIWDAFSIINMHLGDFKTFLGLQCLTR